MNVRQLRSFLQVAEHGSVTRAATVLHIAQPALSRQIHALEDELDVTLFHRSEKGIALTEAGTLLQERAISLLRHFERVRTEVRDSSGGPSGELTIAMPPSMFDVLTFPIVQRFRREYPNVLLRVFEAASGVLNAWSLVRQGKADLAVAATVEPLASLDATPFVEESLSLLGPADAGLTLETPIDLEELVRMPLVALSRPNAGRMMVEAALAEKGLQAPVALEVNTRHMLLSSVEAGLGYATSPICSGFELYVRKRISMAPLHGVSTSWMVIKDREQVLSAAGERMQAIMWEIAGTQISAGKWPLARLLK